jgi:pimeloyl-ACP methyl ester carboxylesterase
MVTELEPAVRAQYPFKSNYLHLDPANDIRLHYLDEGKGKETFLFVHGNPTWSFYWRHLVSALSTDARCVAVDHIGCGLSSKPENYPYRLETHIENLTRLIDALELRDITIVVHDWGGPIGLGAALRRADRIKRVVITNTGAFEGPIPWEIRMCRVAGLGPLAIQGANAFLHVGFLRATTRGFPSEVKRGYLAPYPSWRERIAILNFIQDIPLEPDHPTRKLFLSIGEDIRRFAKLPILICWGERDFCFTPFYREGFQQRFPDAEVHVMHDIAHWVAEDAHDRLVPWIRDFLRRHP